MVVIISIGAFTYLNKNNNASMSTTELPSSYTGETYTTELPKNAISLEKAKEIALENAGVDKKDAVFVVEKQDIEDGVACYDIEFKTSDYEYEYEIDLNGNVLSFDKDPIQPQTETTNVQTSVDDSQYIGVDNAKKTALKDSNLSEKDVVFTKAKLEMENGIYVYEIEFETSTTEFEYEINALTGKIVDKSSEPVD